MNAVRIKGLTKYFRGRQAAVLRDVDLVVPKGAAAAVIGESGAGKTTLGRVISGLTPFDSGSVEVMGHVLKPGTRGPGKDFFQDVQYLFQHAAMSFNPGFDCNRVVEEPLVVRGGLDRRARRMRAAELLNIVGLDGYGSTKARALSGGQAQRLALARAIAMQPGLLVADEVTAGLDTVLKMAVLNLLRGIMAKQGLTVIFITHEIQLARAFARGCAVLYQGMVMESGPAESVLQNPRHPYTRLLLTASPDMDNPGQKVPAYEPPAITMQGCPFRYNCPVRDQSCEAVPGVHTFDDGSRVRCHHPLHG